MNQRLSRGGSIHPPGASGTVFTSNGDWGEWDDPEVTSEDLALKANANNPVFTGTVTVPDGALAIADTSGLQSALDLKAPLASPTFTGTVTLPAVTQSGTITSNGVAITPTELGYVGTLTSDAQTQINAKANSASPTLSNPTFTGTVTVPDGALAIADTSGLQTALDGKAALAGAEFTGTVDVDVNANPAFRVTQADEDFVFFVRTDTPVVATGTGADFVVYADSAFSTPKFVVIGSTGDFHAYGAATIDGATAVSGNATIGSDGSDVHVINGKVSINANVADTLLVQTTGGTDIFSVDGNTGEVKVFNFTFTLAGALNHDGGTVGFFGQTPASQPAANPDTSGASLAALETEVNQLKAALRSLGLIAT